MEVASRSGVGFISKDITFVDWANKWLEVYKKPDVSENTYKSTYYYPIVNHIIPYFKNSKLQNIYPIDIKNFYSSKQYLSKSTLSKIRNCLNSLFETAIDNNLCTRNPAKGIKFTSNKTKNKKKVYTDIEIIKVEKIAETTMLEIVILLETGLRRGELLGLKWSDIDFLNKTISVNKSVAYAKNGKTTINPPKKDSYRINPLSNKAIKVLKSIKKHPNSEYIFPLENGNPQNPYT